MSYFANLFIAIDQLGNTLCGGDPDITISARTGYFSQEGQTNIRMWWRLMEIFINFSFKPFDGPNHCYDSYKSDDEKNHTEGNDAAIAFLGIIIIAMCPFISIFTRVWVYIFPSVGYKYQ